MNLSNKEIMIVARLKTIEWIMEWTGFEVMGICSLTGKYVTRYVDVNFKVFEWVEFNHWASIDDGICKNHHEKIFDQPACSISSLHGNKESFTEL